MQINYKRLVEQIRIPEKKSLLPLFEAITNSVQAISEAGEPKGEIRITVLSKDTLIPEEKEVIGFQIEDNGIGYNDVNFDSFKKLYSDYKIKIGGKGFGRFSWLRVFQKVKVESSYCQGADLKQRAFAFFIPEKDSIPPVRPINTCSKNTRGTLLTLETFDARSRGKSSRIFDAVNKMNCEEISKQIIEHCLSFFMQKACPRISIHDTRDNKTIDVTRMYKKVTKNRISVKNTTIKKEKFKVRHLGNV